MRFSNTFPALLSIQDSQYADGRSRSLFPLLIRASHATLPWPFRQALYVSSNRFGRWWNTSLYISTVIPLAYFSYGGVPLPALSAMYWVFQNSPPVYVTWVIRTGRLCTQNHTHDGINGDSSATIFYLHLHESRIPLPFKGVYFKSPNVRWDSYLRTVTDRVAWKPLFNAVAKGSPGVWGLV